MEKQSKIPVTLPYPLHLLQCERCAPKGAEKATSITLYNRSFMRLPSGRSRRPMIAEIEVLSIERNLDESYVYTIRGVFNVRCPRCKGVRADTHTILSIPLRLLRDMATCDICWNPCVLLNSQASFESQGEEVDLVTVSGVAKCNACNSSHEITKVARIPATDYINQYALAAEDAADASHIPEDGAVDLFFSYSHKDREIRDQIETHLALLKRQGYVKTWHDREIGPGESWRQAIDDKLKAAQIVLLLVSADFIESEYCYGVELNIALSRHEKGLARVIPVVVRPVDWCGSLIGELQALPTGAKPLTTWANRDEGLVNIARGIRNCVEGLRAAQLTNTGTAEG